MNITIYCNNQTITITEESRQPSEIQEVVHINKASSTQLKDLFERFVQQKAKSILCIISNNTLEIYTVFRSLFAFIEAAGGLIRKQDQYLFIHRHGRWDLPKGKLEKKELPDAAAIRECEEECGVQGLRILKALPQTWHIYPYKKYYALKQTHWYLMETNYEGELQPQTEEDIDEVRWFNREEILNVVVPDTYLAIKDVCGFVE